GVGQAGAQVPHEEPVTGVVFRRAWVAGRGTVPTGAALTAPMRRTPVTFIAATMAGGAPTPIPASGVGGGARPEGTPAGPAIADSSVAGSGAARSVVMMHKRVSYWVGHCHFCAAWEAPLACTCQVMPPRAGSPDGSGGFG